MPVGARSENQPMKISQTQIEFESYGKLLDELADARIQLAERIAPVVYDVPEPASDSEAKDQALCPFAQKLRSYNRLLADNIADIRRLTRKIEL